MDRFLDVLATFIIAIFCVVFISTFILALYLFATCVGYKVSIFSLLIVLFVVWADNRVVNS